MSDNYNVYVNDDTEPNVSVSADSDVSALVDDDSNVVLDVEEDAGALLNADINDEELVDVPIEETIGELGADHRRLLHRDAADQHPMSAITGLTDSLTGLQNTIDSGLISVETSVSDVTLLANGKNTVYHSATAPTGGEYKVGDTWFNSSESYCMYKWDGSNWIREQFGNGAFANASIWNATIQDGAITNAKIANATIENGKIKDATIEGAKIKDATITNAKISSLSGDKITANSLTIGKMASDVTGAISSAGATATSYLTYISGRTGICVHDASDESNYANFNSSGMGIYKSDSLVASFGGSSISLGQNSTASTISMCGNTSQISGEYTGYYNDGFKTRIRNVAGGTGIISKSISLEAGTGSESSDFEVSAGSCKISGNSSSSSYIHSMLLKAGSTEVELLNNYSQGYNNVKVNVPLAVTGGVSCSSVSCTGVTSSGDILAESDNIKGSDMYTKCTLGEGGSADANCRLGSTSGGYYRICLTKGGSSKRYKHDIKSIEEESLDPHRLYDAKVVQYKYNEGYLGKDDCRYDKPLAGFVAEDLYEVYPSAVDVEDGKCETWNYRYIIPPMLALIQEQNKRITELEKICLTLKESEAKNE